MGYGRARARGKYRPKSERLMDQVREVLRYHHYSLRTEKTYCQWIVRFIEFHNMTHPRDMGKPEVEAFLSHLAQQNHVAASTQNQAFNAILFLYRHVLDMPERMDGVEAGNSLPDSVDGAASAQDESHGGMAVGW